MATATYLLFVLGLLGGADIALYHSVAHGIRSHADSRRELVVHSLRGPVYAALFVLVPNFTLRGAWFWTLVTLLAMDVAISIWDFSIERESRRFLGGLPSGEYVLHMIMAMVFGALVTSIAFAAGDLAGMPPALVYQPARVPVWVRLVTAAMAVLVFLSGVQDIRAALRLGRLPLQTEGVRR